MYSSSTQLFTPNVYCFLFFYFFLILFQGKIFRPRLLLPKNNWEKLQINMHFELKCASSILHASLIYLDELCDCVEKEIKGNRSSLTVNKKP